ncbi:hypothetical protein OQA88_5987 [Cercophora sp. LCS_1]
MAAIPRQQPSSASSPRPKLQPPPSVSSNPTTSKRKRATGTTDTAGRKKKGDIKTVSTRGEENPRGLSRDEVNMWLMSSSP